MGTPDAVTLSAADRSILQDQLTSLVAFSRGSRHPQGGFAWLDDDGNPELDRPVELWITCRMTHVFALAQILGDESAAEFVDHGVQALLGRFRDEEYGGWYAAVTTDTDEVSQPSDDTKQTYAHAFVILAAASAAAAGHPDAAPLLAEALAVFDRRFWRDHDGMAVDVCERSFVTTDPYRGVNANMHTVEALLAAHDVTGDEVLLQRAVTICGRVVHDFARNNDYRMPEHFDEQWQVQLGFNRDNPADKFRPYGVTIGHLLEWARLALHARTALGDAAPDWLLEDAEALYATAVRDGWEVDGAPGFVYTTDFDGTPVVRGRLHWVVAEGLATAWALAEVTGKPSYRQDYDKWLAYARSYLVDEEHGSWRHELDAANRPAATVWEGKPDTYHAYQSMLLPLVPRTTSFVAGALATAAATSANPADHRPAPIS